MVFRPLSSVRTLATALAFGTTFSLSVNAQPWPAPVAPGGGLDALAPALPLPVRAARPVEVAAELPPCGLAAPAEPSALQSDAGAVDGLEASPAAVASDAALGSQSAPAATDPAPAPAPDVAPTAATSAGCPSVEIGPPPWQDDLPLSLGYEPSAPGTPVKWVRPLGAPRPWLAGLSSNQGMVLGERNLTYRSSMGPALSLGEVTPFSPAWGGGASIGGLQFSNLTSASTAPIPAGKLGFSSVWGKLGTGDASDMQGGAHYGATVGSSSLRYGLTPALTLESQFQNATSLSAAGLGTTYSAGQWGTLQAGATQSRFDDTDGWRYRLGYDVRFFDTLHVGYASEFIGAGYGDLSSYDDGAAASRQQRNTFSAGFPIGAWGMLSGTYSGLHEAGTGLTERRYGLSQSVMLAPGVRFAVGADRDTVSGDFALNLRLSLPMGR